MTPDQARSALQVAAWRYHLGLQPSEQLVGLAVEALVAGLDGQALAELAGTNPRDSREVRDRFVAVLNEQGLDLSDEQTTLWHLVKHTAGQIVEGSLDPFEGAEWLWRSASYLAEPEGDLRIFIGLASEFEDHPEDANVLGPEIVREAAALLARDAPRRWIRVKADPHQALSMWTTGGAIAIDHGSLALPEALESRLVSWSREWRAVLAAGGFTSVEHAEGFVGTGRLIATALQDHLGPNFHVEYYPEPTRPPGLRVR